MRFFIVAVLFICGCATTFQPIEDRTEPPFKHNVYTIDTVACGHPGIATNGCALTKDAPLKDYSVTIRVPNTNTQNRSMTMQIVSRNCHVESVVAVKSGEILTYKLEDLLKLSYLEETCILDIVVVPVWNDQETFTLPTYPMLGRIVIALTDHPYTKVIGDDPFESYGFMRIFQRASQDLIGSPKYLTVDTQGSSAGKIIVVGCGLNPISQSYNTPNPQILIPWVDKTCVLQGVVLRLDAPGDLSFAIAVDIIPIKYLFLRDPKITPAGSDKVLVELDPAVSAVDIEGKLYFGNRFKIKKSLLNGSYNIRQITIGGRQSWSSVKEGVVLWTLQ